MTVGSLLDIQTPSVATHCPYCALQCGIHLTPAPTGEVDAEPGISGQQRRTVRQRMVGCRHLAHPDRLTASADSKRAGLLRPVTWDVARADRRAFRAVKAAFGRDAVGVFGGGSLTNEKAYLLGKFARVALGTANIDYNGRFCMSSAAAAVKRALGVDRGLPFPLEDIPHASLILLVGANPAETMPPMMQYFEAQQRNGGRLIVVDPRRTATAAWAAVICGCTPGTDAALANGLLHILIRDRLVDEAYIAPDGELRGREAHRGHVLAERVERITGISEAASSTSPTAGRAPQPDGADRPGARAAGAGGDQRAGVHQCRAGLGAVGKPPSGFGTITGQGNGQGGREHGQKADQLPGYRQLENLRLADHMASVWNVPESEIPQAGKSAFEMLDALGTEVRALFVMGSNPVVSAPDALRVAPAAACARHARRRRLLSVRDRRPRRRRAALRAVGRRERHDDQSRRPRHPPAARARRRRSGSAPTSRFSRPRRPRSGEAVVSLRHEAAVFDELRRATAGGPADYSGSPTRGSSGRTACSGPARRRITRHSAPLRGPVPDAVRPGRFHATPHAEIADPRDGQFPLLLTTGRMLAHYQSGTRRGARRAGRSPPSRRGDPPGDAAQVGVADGERCADDAARHGDLHGQADAQDP